MPFSAENLAAWLGAAGTSASPMQTSPEADLVTQLYVEELARMPDPFGHSTYVGRLEGGESADDLRRSLHSSLEHFGRAMPVRGAASASFRELQAAAELDRIDVSPETIAECIATYQYSLGRRPDLDGFAAFAATRGRASLFTAVRPIAKSREAVGHHAPRRPPSADDVARHAAASVTPILDAAIGDIALERVVALGNAVVGIEETLRAVARQLARVEELLTLHIATSGHA